VYEGSFFPASLPTFVVGGIHCWYIEKATDFCKLILYPATLLKLFIVPRSFLVDFFRSFGYKIVSCVNRDVTCEGTSSLPICIPFFFFFLPYCSV
jgi:hypothetical protein